MSVLEDLIMPTTRKMYGSLYCSILVLLLCATDVQASPADDAIKQGEALIAKQDYKAASVVLDAAIRIAPKNARAYCNRGLAYLYLGQEQQALECFNKAIALDPKFAPAYYQLGCCHSHGTNSEKKIAVEYFSKAIALDPKNVEAHYYRGYSYEELGHDQKAIEDMNKAITIDPRFMPAYLHRGKMYAKNKRYQLAIDDFSTAIRLAPKCHIANFNRAQAYECLAQHQKAIEDYDKAISFSPNEAQNYFHRGLSYANLGQHRKAIEDYNKAIAFIVSLDDKSALAKVPNFRKVPDPSNNITALLPARDHAAAYYQRGYSYSKVGQYGKAIEDYNKAITLKPKEAEYYYHRYKAYEGLKKPDPARKDRAKAQELGYRPPVTREK